MGHKQKIWRERFPLGISYNSDDKEQGSPLLMVVIEMGKLMNSPPGEDS